MECVNLKQLYGKAYRVRFEASHTAERGHETQRSVDTWHWIIPCKRPRGTEIVPWGEAGSDTELAVSVGRRGGIGKRISQLPFATILQNGDDGLTIGFPQQHFAQVAEIVKPYRRRVVSPESRERLIKQLAQAAEARNSGG